MPSALRFRVPAQGAGIGPHQESGVEWSHVYNLAGAANGYTKWSRQWNLTGFTHDTEFHVKIRNRGSGGRHLDILKSTDSTRVLAVTDTGLTTPLAITSTVATGTAPFVVASVTTVANLRAATAALADDSNLLDGLDSTAFATAGHNHDAAYVNVSGDTMTGSLDIDTNLSVNGNADVDGTLTVDGVSTLNNQVYITPGAGNDNALFIRYSSSRGWWSVGATDVANTDLIFKDPNDIETVRIGHASNPHSLEVFSGDAYFDVNIHVNDSVQVDNDVNIDSNLTVGDHITVTGDSSVFNGTVSFNDQVAFNDPVTVTDFLNVTGTEINLTTSVIDFDTGSAAGFTESTWSGYITAKHDGATIYIPYLSTAP